MRISKLTLRDLHLDLSGSVWLRLDPSWPAFIHIIKGNALSRYLLKTRSRGCLSLNIKQRAYRKHTIHCRVYNGYVSIELAVKKFWFTLIWNFSWSSFVSWCCRDLLLIITNYPNSRSRSRQILSWSCLDHQDEVKTNFTWVWIGPLGYVCMPLK